MKKSKVYLTLQNGKVFEGYGFDESEFWKNKFMLEIFKLKTKKERRLKSTFSL